MQNQNQVLEDLSRLLSSIAGTVAGVGREAEARLKGQFRDLFADSYVTREEFDAVRKLASETREELEKLKARLGPAEALTAETPAAAPKEGNG